ncbi:MAG TPA: lysoplasmalogenase [Pseudomonadota bacterium]|nr:lysoplasmalogenase [Pseudomonadota bacterium]
MSRPASSSVSSSWLLTLLGLCAVVGLFAARRVGLPWLAVLCKPVPVLVMAIWVGLQTRAQPHVARYGRLLALGLLFGMLGDILLEKPPDRFLFGLLAFLIGHVFYIVALWRDDRSPALGRLAPLLLFGAVMLMLLWPGLSALRIPVVVYAAVIVIMGWRAWARVSASPSDRPDAWAGALGATLFLFSDGMLAYSRFIAPLPMAGYMIILTYWAGQLGLARSVLLPPPPPPSRSSPTPLHLN